MPEKKLPHAEGTHSTTTSSREVDATGTKAYGNHTTVRGAEIEVPKPKVESSHTKKDVDPAEDPDIQNSVA